MSGDAPSRAGERLTIAAILAAAADLLERPGGWTQGVFFRDTQGRQMSVEDGLAGRASCMCMAGAIHAVTREKFPGISIWDAAVRGLPRGFSAQHLATFNDAPGRTQAEAVAALRRAAALAQARTPSPQSKEQPQ